VAALQDHGRFPEQRLVGFGQVRVREIHALLHRIDRDQARNEQSLGGKSGADGGAFLHHRTEDAVDLDARAHEELPGLGQAAGDIKRCRHTFRFASATGTRNDGMRIRRGDQRRFVNFLTEVAPIAGTQQGRAIDWLPDQGSNLGPAD
jgi:hypothetical protein